MKVTEEIYKKAKSSLKQPADDKRVAKRLNISERIARQIRNTENWAAYKAINEKKRSNHVMKKLEHKADDAEKDKRIAELEKENAELLKQRNGQFTQGYLFGILTGIVVSIIGVVIVMRIKH